MRTAEDGSILTRQHAERCLSIALRCFSSRCARERSTDGCCTALQSTRGSPFGALSVLGAASVPRFNPLDPISGFEGPDKGSGGTKRSRHSSDHADLDHGESATASQMRSTQETETDGAADSDERRATTPTGRTASATALCQLRPRVSCAIVAVWPRADHRDQWCSSDHRVGIRRWPDRTRAH